MGKDPIVIFGTGRSGTTVFCRMLGEHPDLAWLSRKCIEYPDDPARNRRLMRSFDLPLIGPWIRSRHQPLEAYAFWERHCKGFKSPVRDLVATDVSERNRTQIRTVFSQLMEGSEKRMLLKVTGWPRVGFLKEVFPEAKFIHVQRDGRAVANSLFTVDFWQGWQGPHQWRWGPLSPEDQEVWERHDRSFIVLAALQWKVTMAANDAAKAMLPEGDLLEVTYEGLCADPKGTFEDVVDFCGLGMNPVFGSRLDAYDLRNTNSKWERELNETQKRQLQEVLEGHLQKYGYE